MAHIGIDARLLDYRVGGISRYTKAMIAAFEGMRFPRRLTVFQSRKSRKPMSGRFPCAKLWTPPHHVWERAALSVELARHRLELWHSPDFIAPLRGARRHVITVHDLSFIHYPEYLTAASRRYYAGQIEASTRRADCILAVSQATKRDLIDILDVPAAKISVQPEGVDAAFRPLPLEETAPVLRALDLPETYILFVGTMEPRKNIVGLARAYREVKAALPDAPKLAIVGKPGWHFEQLMQDLGDLNLGADLLIRHAVTDAQLPAVYHRALVLATPSFYEGFGLPALEAMACGTMPIVSDVSALPEITGGVGALVDPRDDSTIASALLKALTDTAWRERQEAAGLRRAARYRWDTSARLALECYEALLD